MMNAFQTAALRSAKTMATSTRQYATSTTSKPKRRVGPIRAGLLGFLLGTGVCYAIAEKLIQDDYVVSTRQLAQSIDSLRASTEKVQAYASVVQQLESDFEKLRKEAVRLQDLERLKRELHKVHDRACHDQLELKTRVVQLDHEASA